jgi:hypothetical protein
MNALPTVMDYQGVEQAQAEHVAASPYHGNLRSAVHAMPFSRG